jgi:hypothetical protein
VVVIILTILSEFLTLRAAVVVIIMTKLSEFLTLRAAGGYYEPRCISKNSFKSFFIGPNDYRNSALSLTIVHYKKAAF